MENSRSPVLMVHGGAWAIPDDLIQAHLAGMRNALDAGWRVLDGGGPALDAVEAAVVVMEEDETFAAGVGSFLNADGRVQLDAILMDGATLRAGGVGCVEHIRNPIRLARKILEESPHVYFVGEGAERFAQEHGIALCPNEELVIPRERQRLLMMKQGSVTEFFTSQSHDTVGAVALDVQGNLASGTSTGGTANKIPGRVGDSSLIGCGCYADNESGAVSTSGWGEPFMRLVLGKWSADQIAMGAAPQTAARMSVDRLERRLSGFGGLILLDASGRIGLAHNTPRMAWGWRTAEDQQVGERYFHE
jgi:beta-aspartyl-peptidase (threonine type)